MEKTEKMKQICFVTCGALPVPAIKGGAIEQLIELLINENERTPKFQFTVVECCDLIVGQEFGKYKYTNFVQLKHPGYKENKLWWKLRGGVRKLTGYDIPTILPFNRRVKSFLCKEGAKFDYIINEGCEVGVFSKPSWMYGSDKFVYHIHCETFSSTFLENTFGHIIAVGDFIKKQFVSSMTRKNMSVWVLKNRIDLSRFNKRISVEEKIKIRQMLGFSFDDFVIIYCGRLIEVKGVKELIEAVLSIDNSKIKLMIVGSSNFKGAKMTDYQYSILNIAAKHKDRIAFTGYVDNMALYRYHKSADIAAVPSICEEAFNIAILEFLASGVPTIATRSGGMVEEGTSETTLFVDKGANLVNNIQRAILELYNDPFRLCTMSKNSIERSQLFDKKSYLDEFVMIINKIECYCNIQNMEGSK